MNWRALRYRVGWLPVAEEELSAFRRERLAFDRARLLICFFYGCLFYVAAVTQQTAATELAREGFDPLWSLIWLEGAHYHGALLGLNLAWMGATLWAVFQPHWRCARVAAFVALFFYASWENSFGKINHGYHLWIFLSFLLIFLPQGWHLAAANRLARRQVLTLFFGCQWVIGLTYSLAGIWKLYYGLLQWSVGQPSVFSPNGASLIVANRLLQTNSEGLLSAFALQFPWLLWLGMLGVLYLQTFASLAALRGRLHAIWGGALILFHLSTGYLLTVWFNLSILLLLIFWVWSPFSPAKFQGGAIIQQLPLLRTILQLARRFTKAARD